MSTEPKNDWLEHLHAASAQARATARAISYLTNGFETFGGASQQAIEMLWKCKRNCDEIDELINAGINDELAWSLNNARESGASLLRAILHGVIRAPDPAKNAEADADEHGR